MTDRERAEAYARAADMIKSLVDAWHEQRDEIAALTAKVAAMEPVVAAAEKVVRSSQTFNRRCDCCKDINHLCAAVATYRARQGAPQPEGRGATGGATGDGTVRGESGRSESATDGAAGKVLLYFDSRNSCCEGGYRSHEQLLADGAVIGTAYLVNRITGKEWGDDWNDAPACCNSGPPYPEDCDGLEIVEVRLGEPFGTRPADRADAHATRPLSPEEEAR